MDEGRLKAVKKGQKLHRKFAYAMNDTIRNRQEYYQNCLSREEQEAHTRLMSKVMDIRKTVVRNRVLLQCLSLHRKSQPDRAHTEPLLGSYGGRPIDSFSRDIDQRLAWFHPRLRRLRKVDRVKQNCIKHGAILDEETIKDRMQDFFSKNLEADSSVMGQSRNLDQDKKNNNNNQSLQKNDNKGDDHDDDDDDFDMRDYHNPIAGATFKLRLHPFGNLVEFNNKGESKKFNLLTRRNVFNNSKLEPKLLAPSGDGNQPSRARSEPHFHRPGDTPSVLPTTRESPLRLSKYPQPLPPIASGDRKTPKTAEVTGANRESGRKNLAARVRDQQENISVAEVNTTLPKALPVLHSDKVSEARTQLSGQSTGLENSEVVKVQTISENKVPKLARRKTLILSPLETSKDMVKRKD